MDIVYRKRYLPHLDVPGRPIFITGCLNGSLPTIGMTQIQQYRQKLDSLPQPEDLNETDWSHKKQKLLFAYVDNLLDSHSPVRHLQDPNQAQIVQNAFLHFANERYHLYAFVVMPSHHHWLFLAHESWSSTHVPKNKTPREVISHSIQSYTATKCNQLRNSTGKYWQHETYDHWVRDHGELLRILHYIEQNPVKAGLAKKPEEYPWSSARIRKQFGISPGAPLPKVT